MLLLPKPSSTFKRKNSRCKDNPHRFEPGVDMRNGPRFGPQTHTSPDILSASSYEEVLQLHTPPANNGISQVYGGFLVDSGRRTGSLDNENLRASNSARKHTASSKLGSSAKRGRPRLELQDETPKQRRRTQIRLAQRSYRQRKEAVIADLQDQILEMQNILANVSDSFSQLHETLLESGLLGSISPDHLVIRQIEQVVSHLSDAPNQDTNAESNKTIETERQPLVLSSPTSSSTLSEDDYNPGEPVLTHQTANVSQIFGILITEQHDRCP